MTAVLAILSRVWPYLLAGLVGAYLGARIESVPFHRLQATFADYRAQVALDREIAQKAATAALQAQIQARLDTEARNGQIVSQLQNERDSIAADRDFARRLLAAAQAKPPASGHPVPTAGDQPGAPADATPSGDRSIAGDLTDAAAESRFCFQQYRALLDQLTPQLVR